MLKQSDILRKAAEGLAKSAPIAEFCRQRFGRGLTVMIGRDARNAMDQAALPLVVLLPSQDELGREVRQREMVMTLEVSVYNEKVVKRAGYEERLAIGEAEELTALALEALAEALVGTYAALATVTSRTDALSFCPVVEVTNECTLRLERVLGA